MSWLYTIVASILEGLTEFLPISSTGHLIVLNYIFKIEHSDLISSFNIFIQSGAILAVINQYKSELAKNRQILVNLFFSFLPTAIIGFTLYPLIKEYLLNSIFLVCLSLIIGGIIIFFLKDPKTSTKIDLKKSILIGTLQAVSIIPGSSRALMVIIGGLLARQSLKDSIRYSFLLAIPTILSATALDLYQSRNVLINQMPFLPHFLVGALISFFSAKIVVTKFIAFISTESRFIYFGYYRIILGLVILTLTTLI
ncbi:hypothetical protein A2572_03200 [Candidatus Collierbacteria bacterium RIFOXYD1_FULL_40_9]|uniref:Undecaprenyl-diphosphatase n=1 Tax=Candidatus Collierbacteria bacterium RIFOXYD1_FULL_40_9 TaxID=1817731 RepID=A0A1F5FWX4_9BACT|nr:MAG: hypothetical protein A2572_03200 [Candidatus Collierbacteria bacterium RIFOXYD1_FULL_40_9]